ncbi:MAG: hypothetical protein JW894_05995 [Bacteroidales bacterium]|nr:hypothetical protein [Bacteroidales bacterium]
MSHEKKLHDGKLKKSPLKSLKEKRQAKKAKQQEVAHSRKPRTKLFSNNA